MRSLPVATVTLFSLGHTYTDTPLLTRTPGTRKKMSNNSLYAAAGQDRQDIFLGDGDDGERKHEQGSDHGEELIFESKVSQIFVFSCSSLFLFSWSKVVVACVCVWCHFFFCVCDDLVPNTVTAMLLLASSLLTGVYFQKVNKIR